MDHTYLKRSIGVLAMIVPLAYLYNFYFSRCFSLFVQFLFFLILSSSGRYLNSNFRSCFYLYFGLCLHKHIYFWYFHHSRFFILCFSGLIFILGLILCLWSIYLLLGRFTMFISHFLISSKLFYFAHGFLRQNLGWGFRFSCIYPGSVRELFDFASSVLSVPFLTIGYLGVISCLCSFHFGFLIWLPIALCVFVCMQLVSRWSVFLLYILGLQFVFPFLCDLMGWFCPVGFVFLDELMCFFQSSGTCCLLRSKRVCRVWLFILQVHTYSLLFLCWIPDVSCCFLLQCSLDYDMFFFNLFNLFMLMFQFFYFFLYVCCYLYLLNLNVNWCGFCLLTYCWYYDVLIISLCLVWSISTVL